MGLGQPQKEINEDQLWGGGGAPGGGGGGRVLGVR